MIAQRTDRRCQGHHLFGRICLRVEPLSESVVPRHSCGVLTRVDYEGPRDLILKWIHRTYIYFKLQNRYF